MHEAGSLCIRMHFLLYTKKVLQHSALVPRHADGLCHLSSGGTELVCHAVFTNRVEDLRLQDLAEGDLKQLVVQVSTGLLSGAMVARQGSKTMYLGHE